MMDELLKGLARKLHDDTKYGTFSSYEDVIAAFERVLRDVGLGELLESGEKMHYLAADHISDVGYERALAKLRAAPRRCGEREPMTATHYFETGMYRDCSCGWKAPHGSWDNSADLRKLWEKHVGAITQDGGPVTDRLQQKALEIVRSLKDWGGSDWAGYPDNHLLQTVHYRMALAGLTAGIAMAADTFEDEYSEHDSPLIGVMYGLKAIRALAKGETQHG